MAANKNNTNMSIEELDQAILEQATPQPEILPSTEETDQPRSKTVSTDKEMEGKTLEESGKISEPISASVPLPTESVEIGSSVDLEVGEGSKTIISDVVGVDVPRGDESVEIGSVEAKVVGGATEIVVDNSAAEKPMEEEITGVSESAGGLLVDPLDEVMNIVAELNPVEAAGREQSQEKDSQSDDVEIIGGDESPEPSSKKSNKRKASVVRLREQPPRSGKKQMTASKKAKRVKVPEPLTVTAEEKPKTVMDEFMIDEHFLEDSKLEEVFDLIKFQGWEHLFIQQEEVDKDLVNEFYKKVSKVEKGTVVYLNFEFKGEELTVSSRDLAYDLGLNHDGFDIFTKGTWPEYVTEEMKKEMELRVCNYYDPNVTDLTTVHMDPKIKILHRLLVQTILPRGSKPALAQIQDILLLDQILRKEKVNLPKMIIHQMEYLSKFQHVGHARFVKKILEFQNVYHPGTEVPVMKQLTMNSIHRWGILLDAEMGWIRKSQLPGKAQVEEEALEDRAEQPMDVDGRISKLEGSLAEIKEILSELKSEVVKMSTSQWIIEEEVSGLKKAIETGFTDMRRQMSATGSKT